MKAKPSKFFERMREVASRLSPRTFTPIHGGSNFCLPRIFNELYRYDLSEIEDLDDLHNPEGLLKEAQQYAARLFGVKESFFSVGGASSAIMAALLSLGEGGAVLIPCNAHKSVVAGLILSGIEPVWYEPEWDSQAGIYHQVDPQLIRFLIRQNPGIKGLLVTSPTYEGIQSDLGALVRVSHHHGIPVLVDESHGAHLSLLGLSKCAISAGADLIVHSGHKSLGALTQTGILHIQSELISRERVQASLSLIQTTSPSFLLLMSLIETIYQVGEDLDLLRRPYDQALKLKDLLQKMGDRGVKVLLNDDPTHCLISVNGYNGEELSQWLYTNGKLETELEGPDWVMLLLGLSFKGSDLHVIQRLIRQAALERRGFLLKPTPPIPKPHPLVVNESPRRAFFSSSRPKLRFKCPPGIPTEIPGSASRGIE